MNEEDAVQKMRDLQVSLETSMRYSRAGKRFPGVFLLTLTGILLSFVIVLISNILDYSLVYPSLGYIPIGGASGTSMGVGIPVLAVWLLLAYAIYAYLKRSFSSYTSGSWDKDLEEGVVGILKILEKEDWQETMIQLRKAKQSFIVISVLQLLFSWGIAFIAIFFLYALLVGAVIGVSIAHPNLYLIGFVAAILVVGLGDRYIRKSYNEIWYMDGLIAELRWFYLEFQGSEL